MKTCPVCGRQLDDAAAFCGSCGERFAAPQQPNMAMPIDQTVYAYQNPNIPPYQQGSPVGSYQDPNLPPYPQAQPVYGYQDPNQFVAQPVFVQPVVYDTRPIRQLQTTRGLVKFILFSLLTCGLYSLVFWSDISTDINTVATRYDGKRTMHFLLLLFIIGPITFGIAYLVWFHNLSTRIGNELKRRGLQYRFGAADFWVWDFLLALTVIGPLLYIYKISNAMNNICASYNQVG